MAAPEGRRRGSPLFLAILLVLPLACSSAPEPVTRIEKAEKEAAEATAKLPPEIPADSAPEAEAAPTSPGAGTGPAPGARRGSSVIVVDSGGEKDGRSQSLVEAAKAERDRRAQASEPRVVITNKTLPKLATGQLTFAEPKKAEGSPAAKPAPASGHDEAYWRARVREIRTRWRKSLDDVEQLEQTAADQRRRFYSEDDPYVRDSQIKPEWDHALDRLQRSRDEAVAAQRELADVLEEGRRDGALPGWLREGSELEPPPPAPAPVPTDAIEPPELGDSPP